MPNPLHYFTFILLGFFLFSPDYALADAKVVSVDVNKRPHVSAKKKSIEESKSIILDIKSKSPFSHIEEEKVWNIKGQPDEQVEQEVTDFSWLGGVIDFLSLIIEAVLWLLPIIVIFYLYQYRDYWLSLVQKKHTSKTQQSLPQTLFGLDIREESLPDDIEHSAQMLWQEQRFRDAVSLLYRASLLVLFKQYRFDLAAGATEQDCIRLLEIESVSIAQQASLDESTIDINRVERFKLITHLWIQLAYAHKPVKETAFQEICQNWNRYFAEIKVLQS